MTIGTRIVQGCEHSKQAKKIERSQKRLERPAERIGSMKTLVEIKVGTILLVVALLCSCALFSGCIGDDVSADYENARRAAVNAYRKVVGPVTVECENRTIDAIVTERDAFPETCLVPDGIGIGDHIIGCFIPSVTQHVDLVDDMIFIYSGRTKLQKLDTAVHEFIHQLDHCMDGGWVAEDAKAIVECAAEYATEGKLSDKCADIPGDYFHLDEDLWDDYGPNTVEAVGCANLEL